MTQTDVNGLDLKRVFMQNQKKPPMRNVPHTRLVDGADIKEIYTFEEKLGQGGFGTVFAATHIETQTKWAIKVICKPEPGSSKFKLLDREVSILKEVNHPHIIHLKEVFETAKKIFLVTELCSGGELKKLLEKKICFTEDETRQIIRSLSDAVTYLHKDGIVHQDLKLENILVKTPLDGDEDMLDIRVSDFGLAEKMDGTGMENMLSGTCGTFMYMAPEKMKERPFGRGCDVWSIGVIMYMLLCGEPPYRSTKMELLLQEISEQTDKFTQPIWNTVSDEAKHILTSLLKEDPENRLAAGELLHSPWTTGENHVLTMQANSVAMMHQEQQTKQLGNSAHTSSSDITTPVDEAVSSDSNCRSPTSLAHERVSNNRCSTPCTSSQLSHAGLKPCRQMSSKQLDKRQNSPYQVPPSHKAASSPRKADSQRPSTSCKSAPASIRPATGCKTKTRRSNESKK